MLRDEKTGIDSRHLCAYLDAEGNLHIDGQDLGPRTAPVSVSGEYEWFQQINASDLPHLLRLLGAPPEANMLDVLEDGWSGSKAGELERLIRESGIRVERFVWSSGFE